MECAVYKIELGTSSLCPAQPTESLSIATVISLNVAMYIRSIVVTNVCMYFLSL